MVGGAGGKGTCGKEIEERRVEGREEDRRGGGGGGREERRGRSL